MWKNFWVFWKRSQNVCYGAWKGAQRKGVETIEVAQKRLMYVMKLSSLYSLTGSLFLVALFLQHHPALCTNLSGSPLQYVIHLHFAACQYHATRSNPRRSTWQYTASSKRQSSVSHCQPLWHTLTHWHTCLSVSCNFSNLRSLWQRSWSAQCSSLSCGDLRTLGSSHTLGNKYSFWPLGSRCCSNDYASCCSLWNFCIIFHPQTSITMST